MVVASKNLENTQWDRRLTLFENHSKISHQISQPPKMSHLERFVTLIKVCQIKKVMSK